MGSSFSLGACTPLRRLPYRLSNGFNLAEYLAVPAATFRVLDVARFVEIALLVGIGLLQLPWLRRPEFDAVVGGHCRRLDTPGGDRCDGGEE